MTAFTALGVVLFFPFPSQVKVSLSRLMRIFFFTFALPLLSPSCCGEQAAVWVLSCWMESAHHSPLGSHGTPGAGLSPRSHPGTGSGRRLGAGGGKGPRGCHRGGCSTRCSGHSRQSWHGTNRHKPKSSIGGRSRGGFLFDSLAGSPGWHGTAGRSPRRRADRARGAMGPSQGPAGRAELAPWFGPPVPRAHGSAHMAPGLAGCGGGLAGRRHSWHR